MTTTDAGGKRGKRTTTRVLIIDDHVSFSESLSMAMEIQDDLEPVGTAATLADGLRLIEDRAPDVVLMDVQLPDGDGIDGTSRAKRIRPQARVLVLTAHTTPEVIAGAAAAGASGFLPKETPIAEVLRAVRTAGEGGMLVDHRTLSMVLGRIRDSIGGDRAPSVSPLTQRETDVLTLMSQGLDVRLISRQLGISLHTCRGHVKSILAKLGVHSQLEAVVTAARKGIITSL